jgi:Ubiquitin carboxyl-terminal hydrolase
MQRKLLKTYLPILCMLMFMALYAGCQGCNRTQVSPSESKQHVGIPNIGNTCYMNSCLQIIARLYPDLFSHMSDNLGHHGRTIMKQLADENSRKYVDEKEAQAFYDALLENYNKENPENKLKRGAQEDAKDVLFFLLNNSNIQGIELYTTTTPIDGNCEPHTNDNPDPSVVFIVDFTGANQANSGDPLSMDNRVENTLYGANVGDVVLRQDVSNTTRGFARIGTKLSIQNLHAFNNRILPIWVKRYNQTSDNDPSSAAKITTHITNPFKLTIPPEYFVDIEDAANINSRRYEAPMAGKAAYTGSLVGFILHTGGLDYGHYTAYVKTTAGKWMRYNDETVTELHAAPLSEAQAAYLYFYQAD